MIRVLFVCMGNICRSPMAEAVFQHKVKEAGLENEILIDSAGTIGYHAGERAHGGTRKILETYGINYTGCARQLARQDYTEFDYILAMDRDNLDDIRSRKPQGADPVIKLFLDYADNPHVDEVPDPYYTGGFQEVYDLVDNGASGLLKAIRTEHAL
jgi:protein-tyrosine phosphatase